MIHEGHFLFILTCPWLEKVVFFLLLLQDIGVWGWGWLWVFRDISATWSGFSLNKKLNRASVFPAGLRLAKTANFSSLPGNWFIPSPPHLDIYTFITQLLPMEKPLSPSSTRHLLKVLRGLYSPLPPSCFSLCLSAGCVAMKTALSQPV